MGGVGRNRAFLDYALFVCFFPQLIAGPIVHYKEMMPQFASVRNKILNYKNISLGIFIFSIGFFKKVVIADRLAVWANNGFDTALILTVLEAWITSLSYTFELYFDFSGYCDMAIGSALLFNIRLPINFNSPYKATDIQDFWRRWHMTLSRFLKDYVYIPLGGNRHGSAKTYMNLMATFILGGIWHGAGWTFVFWGFLHGVALIFHRLWSKLGFRLNKILAWIITFNFINITWVFFRAKELEDAIKVLKGMFGFSGFTLPLKYKNDFLSSFGFEFARILNFNTSLALILFSFFIILCFKNTSQFLNIFRVNLYTMLFSAALFCFTFINLNKVSQFLYFNF